MAALHGGPACRAGTNANARRGRVNVQLLLIGNLDSQDNSSLFFALEPRADPAARNGHATVKGSHSVLLCATNSHDGDSRAKSERARARARRKRHRVKRAIFRCLQRLTKLTIHWLTWHTFSFASCLCPSYGHKLYDTRNVSKYSGSFVKIARPIFLSPAPPWLIVKLFYAPRASNETIIVLKNLLISYTKQLSRTSRV